MKAVSIAVLAVLVAVAVALALPALATPLPTCVGCGEPYRVPSVMCDAQPPAVCYLSWFNANYQFKASWLRRQCNNGYWIQCEYQNQPDGCCNTIGGSSSCPSNTCIPDE